MKASLLALASALYAVVSPATTQLAPAPAQSAPSGLAIAAADGRLPNAGDVVLIPDKAAVEIAIGAAITSKTAKPGDTFPIVLATPLVDETGATLLPAGVPGFGEVIHAKRAGFGGRAGEMIITARALECGDARIPLGHFHFSASGPDRSKTAEAANAAAAGASVLAPLAGIGGLAAFVIHGGEVLIPAGARAEARTTAAVAVSGEAVKQCAASPANQGKS